MELLGSPTSPYVRKCRVVAHETGQADDVKISFLGLTPVSPNETVTQQNPLDKVPVLLRNDGVALFDSRVIVEFLDAQSKTEKMFPETGPARWNALRLQAIGDGIMDAAVFTRFYTGAGPEQYHWPEFLEGQIKKVTQALDVLEIEADELGHEANIGTVAVACALGYLDFRYSEMLDWRAGRDSLAAWYAEFSKRSSMRETEHYQP